MKASVSEQTGSTLLEALIAMCILTVGLLGLAQVFTFGLRQSAARRRHDDCARESA